jgi:uncharacterized membrane protein YhdT
MKRKYEGMLCMGMGVTFSWIVCYYVGEQKSVGDGMWFLSTCIAYPFGCLFMKYVLVIRVWLSQIRLERRERRALEIIGGLPRRRH